MSTTKEPTQALARIDPQSLLAMAVEKGAGVDTLERLVALAKMVREDQARAAWYEAISEFQGACPEIKKKSEAAIYTSKGSYRYKYAELPEIMVTIRPILRSLGLSVFWHTRDEPGKISANCFVAHVDGHVEESGWVSMPLPNDQDRGGGNPLQRAGSGLSYARRYSLMAILGIAPEDDDDAQSAGVGKSLPKPVDASVTTPKQTKDPPTVVPDVTMTIQKSTPPPENSGRDVAAAKWLSEIEGATTQAEKDAIWKRLTIPAVWKSFTEAQREAFIQENDRRQIELDEAKPA